MSEPATHATLFYDGPRQYAAEAGGFLRDGLGQGHRALVMAPPARVDALRAELGRDADEVTFVEESVAYAPQWNAYRVLLDFAAAAPGVRSRVIAEQSLADRPSAELVDYQRLEAAINLVFAESPVDLLCPYDAGSLPAHLLDIAHDTHAVVRADGVDRPNPRFDDPLVTLEHLAAVVLPPSGATTFDCSSTADLALARRLVRRHGTDAGLTVRRDRRHGAGGDRGAHQRDRARCAPRACCTSTPTGPTWVCHVQDARPRPDGPCGGAAAALRALRPRLRAVAGPAAVRRGRRRAAPHRHPRAPARAHGRPSTALTA